MFLGQPWAALGDAWLAKEGAMVGAAAVLGVLSRAVVRGPRAPRGTAGLGALGDKSQGRLGALAWWMWMTRACATPWLCLVYWCAGGVGRRLRRQQQPSTTRRIDGVVGPQPKSWEVSELGLRWGSQVVEGLSKIKIRLELAGTQSLADAG